MQFWAHNPVELLRKGVWKLTRDTLAGILKKINNILIFIITLPLSIQTYWIYMVRPMTILHHNKRMSSLYLPLQLDLIQAKTLRILIFNIRAENRTQQQQHPTKLKDAWLNFCIPFGPPTATSGSIMSVYQSDKS